MEAAVKCPDLSSSFCLVGYQFSDASNHLFFSLKKKTF